MKRQSPVRLHHQLLYLGILLLVCLDELFCGVVEPAKRSEFHTELSVLLAARINDAQGLPLWQRVYMICCLYHQWFYLHMDY